MRGRREQGVFVDGDPVGSWVINGGAIGKADSRGTGGNKGNGNQERGQG